MSTLAKLPDRSSPEARRKFCERLLAVMEANPNLSAGQLLHRSLKGVPISYLEDDELLSLVEDYLPKSKRRALAKAS